MMYAGDHIVVERHGKAVAVMIPIEDYVEMAKSRGARNDSKAPDRHQQTLSGIQAS